MSSVAPVDLPVGKDHGTLEAVERAAVRRRPKTERVKKRLTSRTATIVVAHHRGALDDPDVRPVHLVVPARRS